MVEYVLDGLHVVTMSTVELDQGEVRAVRAQVEHALLELTTVHAGLLEERLENDTRTSILVYISN